jgi:hypothetical protein
MISFLHPWRFANPLGFDLVADGRGLVLVRDGPLMAGPMACEWAFVQGPLYRLSRATP